MSLIKRLKNQIRDWRYEFDVLFPKVPIHTERKNNERKLVSLYSNGQISLYLGKYLTSKDIEKRKDKLASYNFLERT